jgi:hypothetical protein
LAEIGRCISLEFNISNPLETLLLANDKYNKSLHSVIGERPIDVFHARSEQFLNEISKKIENAQIKMLKYHNKRKRHRVYRPGDIIFVKITNRVGNKLTSRYKRAIVSEDLGTKVKADGKLVHKNNIK